MKQTAVEWLLGNLISDPISEADFENNINCWNEAEEIEKKQKDEFAIGFAEWLFENCDNFPKEDQSLILRVYKKEKGL
jgi:hypothetical protein